MIKIQIHALESSSFIYRATVKDYSSFSINNHVLKIAHSTEDTEYIILERGWSVEVKQVE